MAELFDIWSRLDGGSVHFGNIIQMQQACIGRSLCGGRDADC